MLESILAFLSLFFSEQNQYITMFLSAFLSATILPGNSEILFSTFASQMLLSGKGVFSESMITLILVATLGNALGSVITYLMGLLMPKPQNLTKPYALWALEKSEKYGVLMLLFSSLPLIGDLLCAMAGWLRFPFWQAAICIIIGKFVRYLLLLAGLYPILGYFF